MEDLIKKKAVIIRMFIHRPTSTHTHAHARTHTHIHTYTHCMYAYIYLYSKCLLYPLYVIIFISHINAYHAHALYTVA